MNDNLKKNFIWNTIGSLTNAMTSLVFLIIVTRINGIDEAGIFTFAFSTACLLYIIGLYSGRTYQVTESNNKILDYDYIYSRIITSCSIIVLALLFSIIKQYDVYKTFVIVLLAIFKSLESFIDVIYGIMQKQSELYKSGISMFLKALFGIIIFIIIDLLTKNIIYSVLSLIVVYLLIFIFYDLPNFKKYKINISSFDIEKIIYILKFGFFTFLVTFLTQYVINAPKYAIDNHLTDNYQTIYGIISMPATVMALCSLFLIQPFLNKLTELKIKNDYKGFNSLTIKLLMVLLIIGLILIFGTYILGIPFLQLLYNVNLSDQLFPLMIVIIGSVLYGLTSIISNALIVLRKTFVQSIIFITVSVLSLIISELLVKMYGLIGASFSYFIAMLVLLIMYSVFYLIIIKRCDNNE